MIGPDGLAVEFCQIFKEEQYFSNCFEELKERELFIKNVSNLCVCLCIHVCLYLYMYMHICVRVPSEVRSSYWVHWSWSYR